MRLWNADEWASKVKSADWPKVRDALLAKGIPVEGLANGKPQIAKDAGVSPHELQKIVERALQAEEGQPPRADKPKRRRRK